MTDNEKNNYVAKLIADMLHLPLGDPPPNLETNESVEDWTKINAGNTTMRDLDEIFRLNTLPMRFESKLIKTRKLWNFVMEQL